MRQAVGKQIKGIIKTNFTEVILDTTTEKEFTIGIHLDNYKKIPNDLNKIELEEYDTNQFFVSDTSLIDDQGILVLKDTLNLSSYLPKELLINSHINGAEYEIQTAIKRTLNNRCFTEHNFTIKHIEYTIICSEILQACSDEYCDGVLFIIFKKGIDYPKDVSEILSIFNRVTANYVSKYNTCILDQIVYKKNLI